MLLVALSSRVRPRRPEGLSPSSRRCSALLIEGNRQGRLEREAMARQQAVQVGAVPGRVRIRPDQDRRTPHAWGPSKSRSHQVRDRLMQVHDRGEGG